MCSKKCAEGSKHREECPILARCKPTERPSVLQVKGENEATNAYSVITPLRTLLLQEKNDEGWARSNQLMDHINGTRSKKFL